MGLVELVTAVVKVTFTLIFMGLLVFVLYKGLLGKRSEKITIWLKYNVFKRKYNPKVVEDAIKTLEKNPNMHPLDFAKDQVIKYGYKPKFIGEIVFIFDEVKKSTGGQNG